MSNIKRICIIGAPGTGKTTLAKKLEEIYKLPVCHLDSLHQLPNWVLREETERDKLILEKTDEDKWILDGTFTNTLPTRIQRADMVIFLDYPTRTALSGVIQRIYKDYGKEKPDMPGCKEKFDLSFLIYVATYNLQRRKIIVNILENCNKEKLLVFKNRKELKEWIDNIKKS